MGAIGSQCKPTNDERETIIRWDESGNECIIYTCNKTLIARLDRYCKHNPKQWELYDSDDTSKSYKTTKKLITIREKSQRSTMTEEQKQAAAERLRKVREK